MRLYQTWKNYAAQLALGVPGLSRLTRRWLVDLHTDVFLEASNRHEAAREPHLRAVFDASIDVYRRALAEGYPEAEAREITHIQGSIDFHNHGWAELVEFPPDEVDDYYDRYRGFYERHGCTLNQPFGEFAPPGGLPAAPETPDAMEDGDFPLAEPGLTDDVYVPAQHLWVRT